MHPCKYLASKRISFEKQLLQKRSENCTLRPESPMGTEPLSPDPRPFEGRPRAREANCPEVSVILPAYRSHETVGGCLEALRRQTFRGFEVIVVDSSPDECTADVVRESFPEVHLIRPGRRMLPHTAREEGVRNARGGLLAFLDPDVYARPDWLSELVAAHRETGRPVVGSLSCNGERRLDVAIHLCKFSKWLPGGAPRPVDMSPTANMLIDRPRFEATGFDGDHMLADVVLTWRLVESGATLWFVPRAEVAHHHLSTFGDFLRERYTRGVTFGELRAGWNHFGRGRSLLYLLVSALPVRLARLLPLVARHCRGAGLSRQLLATFPLVLLGHGASLLGESRAYLRRLLARMPGKTGPHLPAPPSFRRFQRR